MAKDTVEKEGIYGKEDSSGKEDRKFGIVMSAAAIIAGAVIVYNSALKSYEAECRELSSQNYLPDPVKFCSNDCKARGLVSQISSGLSFDEAYFTVMEECRGKK